MYIILKTSEEKLEKIRFDLTSNPDLTQTTLSAVTNHSKQDFNPRRYSPDLWVGV